MQYIYSIVSSKALRGILASKIRSLLILVVDLTFLTLLRDTLLESYL
jgi:hypothetical protein